MLLNIKDKYFNQVSTPHSTTNYNIMSIKTKKSDIEEFAWYTDNAQTLMRT